MKRFTTSSSAFYDNRVDKKEFSGQIHFLLCQGCLWCASFIGINKRMITQCPKSNVGFSKLHKQIELIGIEVKDLNEQAEPGRFQLKTKVINQHFIVIIAKKTKLH